MASFCAVLFSLGVLDKIWELIESVSEGFLPILTRPFVYWFWRRRFSKYFTIYGHGSLFGHVTHFTYINVNACASFKI